MSNKEAEPVGEKSTEASTEEKAREEGWKLLFEMYKHMTTLSTGSILILVALLEKLFTNPQWKGLVIIALCCFVFSIICAVFSMYSAAHFVKQFADIEEDPRSKLWSFFDAGCTISFVLGIFWVVIFAVRNLYG